MNTTIFNTRRRLLRHGLAAALPWSVAWPLCARAQAPSSGALKEPLPARGGAASGIGERVKVTFATNWKAQAAHGGFYQAVADGTYQRLGLEVNILQGGPSVNNRPLLPAGRIDFLMTGNLLHSFDNLRNQVPTVVVAALFQKDPQALMAHPGQGYESFEALRRAPVAFIAKDAQFTWWAWLKAVHGFRDEQLKPYNYNLGPWLANPKSIQQGYAVAEPLYAQRQGGFTPVVHLLADHGFSTYSTVIETRRDLVAKRPEVVQKFVDGSIVGWTQYLHGNPQAAHTLMQRENPDMGEDELMASRQRLLDDSILEAGDALKLGIGTMKRERAADFLQQMVRAGLYKPSQLDVGAVLVEDFVNRGVGLDLRRRLLQARQTPR
ncbi:MAG: ABC transporter substrate-binding protein [Betaproteobacteria bacterium]|nr:ABC transporter substrate-binding protein [Betaproteobacteria bacterium]